MHLGMVTTRNSSPNQLHKFSSFSVNKHTLANLDNTQSRLEPQAASNIQSSQAWQVKSPTIISSNITHSMRIPVGYPSARLFQLFCEEGRIGDALDVLDKEDRLLSVQTYRLLVQACKKQKALADAQRVHAHIASHGLELDTCLGNSIVHMYVNCGSFSHALKIFSKLRHRSIFSWTAIISGYLKGDQCELALELYGQMRLEGLKPSKYLFLSLLRACTRLADFERGRQIHAEIIGSDHGLDLFLGTTLVDMYAKCGSMECAQHVFDTLPERDVVTWNAMIAGYVQQEKGEIALNLYNQMRGEGVKPNDRTFVSALKSCGMLETKEQEASTDGQATRVDYLQMGREIHAEVVARGYELGLFVGTTLVDMYAKCGSMSEAENVFQRLPERDAVAWSAMIAGYAQQGQGANAMQLFARMQEDGVTPDSWTFVSVLKACGSLADTEDGTFAGDTCLKPGCLAKGTLIHAEVARRGFESDLFICNSLIHMYGKCGSVESAQRVFDKLTNRNVVTWTAVIAAYAQQGQNARALELYSQMQAEGVRPDQAAVLSILTVCSNLGALEICLQIHQDVIENGISWSVNAASNLIHAYSRCGSMANAQLVFDALPMDRVVAWNSLVAAYARQGECRMSLTCFAAMQQAGVKPDGITFISVLTACSHAGLLDEGLRLFYSMGTVYGIAPNCQHYAILVDLLGRAGLLRQVEELISQMPVQPDLSVWLSILGACRIYGDVELGELAFERATTLEPEHSAAYVLMSRIYALASRWDDASKVQDLRRIAGAVKKPGQSWIEHCGSVHIFNVGDKRHQQSKQVYANLIVLNGNIEVEQSLL